MILTLVMLLPSLVGCGVIKGDTVMQLGDYKITEAMYSLWAAAYKTKFMYMYANSRDTETFWNTKVSDDMTYEDFFNEFLYGYAKERLISMKLFDDYALTISSDTKESLDEYLNGLIEAYGSRSELNAYLGNYGLNINTLEHICYVEEKYNVVISYLFGTNGLYAVTDTDRENYYKDNYRCVDWIYVYTENKLKKNEDGGYEVDSSGNYILEEMTDDEKTEQAKKVAEIKAKIDAGENFGTLKKKYSEEELEKYEYISNINISSNDLDYGIEFLKTVQSLDIGKYAEYSDGDGVYIILRKELAAFSELSEQDLSVMNEFDTYVLDDKANKFYDSTEVAAIRDVIERYDVKTLKGLTNTNVYKYIWE